MVVTVPNSGRLLYDLLADLELSGLNNLQNSELVTTGESTHFVAEHLEGCIV